MNRLAAILLTLVLTCAGMYVGMRIAGPVTRGYNLGSLSYEIEPALHGNSEILIPHTGVRLQAKLVHAPFILKVKPKTFSLTGLAEAGIGVRSALDTAKSDIVHGATWAFVRAFLYALGGGLIGAGISALLVFFFFRLGTAILCGVIGVLVTLVVVGGSGFWVWRAHYIQALEHPTVVSGPHRTKLNLTPLIRKIRRAHSLEDVIHDLAPVLVQVARG
jgi:hypothetical protein